MFFLKKKKGLKPGDRWCLCVLRWIEAAREGVAPPVILESTHQSALEFVSMQELHTGQLSRLREKNNDIGDEL